ncbi:MAG: FHA domain-containing protein, partial [Actinomycetota bacterium]|nr:FHA domain-containing protein [Actinomycetota bacterium]
MTTIGHSTDAVQDAGEQAEAGSFVCLECSLPLALEHVDSLPRCPGCGGSRFKRASIFTNQPTLTHAAVAVREQAPGGWLDDVRSSIAEQGQYLAVRLDGRARVFEVDDGWSRIGRSSSADIRLDDPTVSRRHAVVVRTPEGELRVLDDRSMNGIAVNGESVDWSVLVDGDELQVGRYT